MNWGGPFFVLAIVAICTASWVINNWIRTKHGYAPTNEWGVADKTGRIDQDRQVELLTNENEKLVGKVSRLEERIAVLERIATDPAERTARDIDALR